MLVIKHNIYIHMPYTVILDCSEGKKKYISHKVFVWKIDLASNFSVSKVSTFNIYWDV